MELDDSERFDTAWDPQRVIGHNVAMARRACHMTQTQLGERVEPYLGAPWKPQTVSAMELGKRAFTAKEVVMLADLLGTSPGSLERLPVGVVALRVGDVIVPRERLEGGIHVFGEASQLFLRISEVTNAQAQVLNAARRQLASLDRDLEAAKRALSSLVSEMFFQVDHVDQVEAGDGDA